MWKWVGKYLAKALVWAVEHPDTVTELVNAAKKAKKS